MVNTPYKENLSSCKHYNKSRLTKAINILLPVLKDNCAENGAKFDIACGNV